MAEATWSSLERELVHRYVTPDRAAARRAIFAWISRYNTRRRSRASATSKRQPKSSSMRGRSAPSKESGAFQDRLAAYELHIATGAAGGCGGGQTSFTAWVDPGHRNV